MTDDEMTVEEIKVEVADAVDDFEREQIRLWLKQNGYDGLWNNDVGDPACGCHLDDLAPCGDGPWPECEVAHKREDGFMYPGKIDVRTDGEREKDAKFHARRIGIDR